MSREGPHLTVKLHNINDDRNDEPFRLRTLILSAPTWSMQVGRGTHNSDGNLEPAAGNAWFDSRVMSRNHAVLRANPDSKELTIEDVGSMHGTQVAGRRIKSNVAKTLYEDDVLVFGAEVTRGSACFPALEARISFKWSDDKMIDGSRPTLANNYRNSFTADYSEDEEGYLYDSDRSDREPSVEVIIPARHVHVPNSAISITSSESEKQYEPESPNSSPQELREESVKHSVSTHDEAAADAVYLSQSPVYSDEQESESDYGESGIFEEEDLAVLDQADTVGETSNFLQQESPLLNQGWPLRAASPSDVAATKLAEAYPRSPPFYRQNHVDEYLVEPASSILPDVDNRVASSWAGHNSVLYEPMAISSCDHYLPNISCGEPWVQSVPEPSNTGVSNRSSSQFDMTQSAVKLIAQSPQAYCSQENTTKHIDGSNHLPQGYSMYMAMTPRAPPSPGEELSTGIKAGVKRKAAHISQDSNSRNSCAVEVTPLSLDTHATFGKSGAATTNPEHIAPTVLKESVHIVETTTGLKSPLTPTEPPRKRLKKSKSKSSFMRFAATALAGAAVGMVGTIYGLAALPPDYFV